MDIVEFKAAYEWFLLRACFAALAALIATVVCFKVYEHIGRLKAAAKRYGWPLVTLFIVCSAWAMYTAFPTAEEKNGSQGSVVRGQESELTPNPYSLTPNSSLTQEDFARGFVLTRIETNELHDFTAPLGASICDDWKAFGAAEDWVYLEGSGVSSQGLGRERLRVHSDGWVEALSPTSTVFAAREYYPFKAPLGIVPEANWERIVFSRVDRVEGSGNNLTQSSLSPQSGEQETQSCFWNFSTASNSLQLTWQNVLYNRESDMPISFQVEFYENGDFTYRYNLSAIKAKIDSGIIPENFPSNITIGTTTSSHFPLPTSLTFRRLDPTDTPGSDRDGDGLIIEDELFVYRTDPYNADSDYDGLSDYDEIFIVKSNPLDAYSISNDYYDGFTSVLNGEDPFSYPQDSTNTVLEHVFYSGSTNGVFSLPVSTDETAVLKVSVSGSGIGRLIVGKKVVPLVAQARRRSGAVTNTLLLALGRGVKKSFWYEKPEGLEIAIDSDDLLIGMVPSNVFRRGWIAFPHTKSTEPCIHDFEAKNVRVSLVYGEEFSGLTSIWRCESEDVVITNEAPVASEIYAKFSRNNSRLINYEVDHPLRLNETNIVYTQELRFCPKLSDDEADVVENDENESPDIERCRCSSVASCDCCSDEWCYCYYSDCPCDKNLAPTLEDDDEDEDDFNSAYMADPLGNVFYLYRSNAYTLHLDVSGGEPKKCCPCPSHWGSNYVSKVSATQRVTVKDSNGENFTVAYEPCSVTMSGVSPSRAFADSTVFFFTNGASYKRIDCTVLGVNIESPPNRISLDRYNNLSARLGFPMEFCTNLERAAQLVLKSDILMTNGVFKISLENVTGDFQVWLPAWQEENGCFHESEKLLDSQSRPVRYLSMRKWRSLLRRYKDASKINVILISSTPGSCKLKFEYVAADGGNRVYDFAEQRITSVLPPLRVDLTRDGSIDNSDLAALLGNQIFYYWINQDTIRGDRIGQIDNSSLNSADLIVNGTFDLVNFFPVALDLSKFTDAWGDRVTYTLHSEQDNADSFNFCFADVPWNQAGAIQTTNVTTLSGQALSSAPLTNLPKAGYQLHYYDTLRRFSGNSGLLICEAKSRNAALRIEIKIDDTLLYSYSVPMTILPVKEMYSWYNFRNFSGEASGRETTIRSHVEEYTKSLIFLHGANVSSAEAEVWGDILFKRLWISGSKARFYNIDWRSDIDSDANYHQNASNAFVVASQIVSTITNNIPGEKVIMAHSLGNMVVSSMIQDYRLEVSKYLMCNSAVPAEAYDTSLALRVPQLVHPDWEEYPTNSWTATWHTLFKEDPNDDRKHLGWTGRFANVLSKAVNFYSAGENGGDEVLELAADNDVGILTGITSSFAHHAWHKQELFKGRGIGVGAGATDWSGWNIEENWLGVNKISVEQALSMNNADFKTNTVFYCYPSSMNATNISLLVRGAHLAQGIPALTPAAGIVPFGGNPMMDFMVNVNENNSSGVERPNGWPSKPSYPNRWLHSDMKDVSYFFNFKFYEKLIEKGNLR